MDGRSQSLPSATSAELRDYVLEEWSSADAALIADETGFLKKGLHSVGVKRQYTGTAGRIENSQVGGFLCYAGNKDAALVVAGAAQYRRKARACLLSLLRPGSVKPFV